MVILMYYEYVCITYVCPRVLSMSKHREEGIAKRIRNALNVCFI